MRMIFEIITCLCMQELIYYNADSSAAVYTIVLGCTLCSLDGNIDVDNRFSLTHISDSDLVGLMILSLES